MLFNSYPFLFFFLPCVFLLFYYLNIKTGRSSVIAFLFVASLFFYGYWNSYYLPLLICSIVINYSFSALINRFRLQGSLCKGLFISGILLNISVLVYFKYALFVLANLNYFFDLPLELFEGDLPLGISFFTFTQIAFLSDCYKKRLNPPSFVNYGLFVTYFPHLMAGPILHHEEIMPQFENTSKSLFQWSNLAIGLSIFSIGLFKKTMIADSLAPFVNSIFANGNDALLPFIEAWLGAIAYTFQLYFDFSGYSDMAIGLARIFGIIFPLNFNSPYKSLNIIDFWRRWHMTLSRFLRDYIYIPLGGNRAGVLKRYLNLMTTMLIGGIWHGAAWTFIFWGVLHGFYLICNHLWLYLKQLILPEWKGNFLTKFISIILTFVAVVIGWVFFRAESFSASMHFIQAMFRPDFTIAHNLSVLQIKHLGLLEVCLGFIVFCCPNTQQLFLSSPVSSTEIMGQELLLSRQGSSLQWQFSSSQALYCALLTIISLLALGHVNEFLYYKF